MAFLDLGTDIQYVKGVGPKLGAMLARMGFGTVGDMLENYPRAYEDRRAARSISSLQVGEIVSVAAHVIKVSAIPMGASRRRIYEVTIGDATGQIRCKFFRVPYKGYFERFRAGQEVRVVGKVIDYRGRKEFHHPELKENVQEEELSNEIHPIYSETEGLASQKFYKIVHTLIQILDPVLSGRVVPEDAAWYLPKLQSQLEKIPVWIQQQYQLSSRWQALKEMHEPPETAYADFQTFKSAAQRRIIFEELFWLEVFLAIKKTDFKKEQSYKINPPGHLKEKLKTDLPFQLTGAQLRAFEEINADLKSGVPMHRLVQGDVGSGKTLVVFLASLQVIEAGLQACLMVPTEILAEQHFKNAQRLLMPLGVKVGLLTAKTKTTERRILLEQVARGELHFLIGTHALIEDQVQFLNLALVSVDEQHRFGVEQRGKLKAKGKSPHFLVLTATPIPRTLAMTAYGDLDVSIINEMPPGRSPIQTRVTFQSKKDLVWQFMLDQLAKGRQAYVIYPLVEESEKIDLKDAVSEFEKLKALFPQVRFGLLHGKMKGEEKDKIMTEFREGQIQVLVSTTVIEVGVDVPNANLMIIEHAERFGLSQLHQLRGRVGRGSHKSFCVLVLGHAVSNEARERTTFLETTTDGFKVAEFDLEIRGPGEFLGKRQSGLPGFKMANLVRDQEILMQAREAAFLLLQKDPELKRAENQSVRIEVLRTHGPLAFGDIG